MIKYVVGFAFSRNKTEVVLILKQKPDWQAGKLNGIGGKIEELDQSPHHAMSREFAEETGVKIPMILWHRFAVLKGIDYKAELHCFRLFTNRIYLCKSMEQEEIRRMSVDTLFNHPIIAMNNLKVLIPMALDENFLYGEIQANIGPNS